MNPTSQLVIEDITDIPDQYHNVIMFDPNEVYQRIYADIGNERFERHRFSHYKRFNSLHMSVLFPNESKICACGCKIPLTGRRSRWATDNCSELPLTVFGVIAGKTEIIKPIIESMHGNVCWECGINNNDAFDKYYKPTKTGIVNSQIHLDHIIPVHQGGGACWLGNYQLLCKSCHNKKSKDDLQLR